MKDFEKALNYINWDEEGKIVEDDISTILEISSSKITDSKDIIDLWDIIISNNSLIAYDYIENRELPYYQIDYKDQIKSNIISDAVNKTINTENVENIALGMATLFLDCNYQKSITDSIMSLSRKKRKRIICEIIKNIDRLKNESYMVRLCKELYSIFNINEEYIETLTSAFASYNLEYHILKEQEKTVIKDIARDSLNRGYFRWVDKLLDGFSMSIQEVDFSREEYLKSLKECSELYVYRGVILFKESCFSDDEEGWTEWYNLVCKLRTDIPKRELEGYRFMYVCSLIKLNPQNPQAILSEKKMSDTFEEIPERKRYVQVYRLAVKALLENNSRYLMILLNNTSGINSDENIVTTYNPRPSNVRKQLGIEKTDYYLDLLINYSAEIEEIIYIYLNTFLRGIIPLSDFIERLSDKYGSHYKKYLNKIEIGGFLQKDKRLGEFYLSAINIIGDEKDKIGNDYRINLRKDVQEYINGCIISPKEKYIDTYLVDYDEKNNKYYAIIKKQTNPKILNELIEFIINDNRESIEEGEVYKRRINFNRISKDDIELFWRSNKILLEKMVEFALAKKDVNGLISFYKNVNYFHFYRDNATKNWKTVKTIGLDKELIDVINESIDKLKTNNIDTNICFKIYNNSMMKRFISLGQFLEIFNIDTEKKKKKFFEIFPKQIGYIVNTNWYDEDNYLVREKINGVGIQLRSASKTERLEEKLEYVTRIKNKTMVSIRNEKIKTKVRFRIGNYTEDGVFQIEDLEELDKDFVKFFVTR